MAFRFLNKADSLGVVKGNDITLMGTRFLLASVHYKIKNYDEVIAILEKSVALTEYDSLSYPNDDENYKLLAGAKGTELKSYMDDSEYELLDIYL